MAVMISMPNHNIHTRGSAILWEQRDYRSNANPSTEGGIVSAKVDQTAVLNSLIHVSISTFEVAKMCL